MSIMKESYVETGNVIPQKEQKEKIYNTIVELSRELGRGVLHPEIREHTNTKYGPRINFSLTQTSVALNRLVFKDKKVKSEEGDLGAGHGTYFSPIEE